MPLLLMLLLLLLALYFPRSSQFEIVVVDVHTEALDFILSSIVVVVVFADVVVVIVVEQITNGRFFSFLRSISRYVHNGELRSQCHQAEVRRYGYGATIFKICFFLRRSLDGFPGEG